MKKALSLILLSLFLIVACDDNPVDSVATKGDLDLNGQSGQLADIVIFWQYYLRGIGSLPTPWEEVVSQSDINRDALPFGVDDFVLLNLAAGGRPELLTGEFDGVDTVNTWYAYRNGVVHTSSDIPLAAIYIVVDSTCTPDPDISINYRLYYDTSGTRMIIGGIPPDPIRSISGLKILDFAGSILQIQGATTDGRAVVFERQLHQPEAPKPEVKVSAVRL